MSAPVRAPVEAMSLETARAEITRLRGIIDRNRDAFTAQRSALATAQAQLAEARRTIATLSARPSSDPFMDMYNGLLNSKRRG